MRPVGISVIYRHNWVYQLTPLWAMVGSLTLSVIAHEYEHESIYTHLYMLIRERVSWVLVSGKLIWLCLLNDECLSSICRRLFIVFTIVLEWVLIGMDVGQVHLKDFIPHILLNSIRSTTTLNIFNIWLKKSNFIFIYTKKFFFLSMLNNKSFPQCTTGFLKISIQALSLNTE